MSFGFIQIRYYSLAYILGILFVIFFLKKYAKSEGLMTDKNIDDWLLYAVLGIIFGGRLGYVLFYNFSYFISHPLEIFSIWQGGMSFHGGFLGAVCAMYLFCKKNNIDFLKLSDLLAISSPIGLFFGRIANFINMELYGRVTGSDFGVIFPNIDNLPRHPSQIYEAILEGLLIFVILFYLKKYNSISKIRGVLSALFVILYGCARLFCEYFRQPDSHIGFLFDSNITMGQILSVPVILIGFILLFFFSKRK
ncbi:prolipoprotein diacylglyceryl transferase [Rickettsiales bacterium]|nr:prolipoprotein diacylglyceryl transferase [Rickettsiales bacterium]